MSIKTFTSKFATRLATLTMIVGSMMSLDSHAQVANAPSNSAFASAVPKNMSTEVSPEARATVMTTLRQSTNSINFEKNAGQYGDKDVLYGFRTHFGSMGVYNNKLRLISKQEDPNQDRDINKPAPVQIVDITFPGANNNWTVEPGSKSSVHGAYFDENGKATRPDIYNEITLKNVYPGVDLRLYSGKAGTMEFDWLVAKASDYDKIKLHMVGQDALNISDDGNLTIKLRLEDMKMAIPETYQILGNSKKSVKASMLKADDNTVCYKVNSEIDPNQPLVIDPVMVWATFMVGGDAQFDEYLYAVATTPAGNVYCGGVTNQPLQVSYMSGINAAPGFNTYTGNTINGGSSAGAGSSEAIIYEFNSTGTAIVAWAYTTILVPYNGGQQGPPESTQSLPLVPTSMGIFPNGRVIMVYSEDLIQVWSSDLTSVSSSSASPASPLTNAQYNSVVVVDDSTFYLSGITTTAYPSDIYPLAPDAAFGGSEEGIILRETHANSSPFAPVCSWGTYVGGNGNENFATIAISYDHTKIAFAVHSVVPSGTLGYPTLVNAVDNNPGAAATTEILIGSFAVSATPQTAFTMFSYLGGTGNEGLTVESVPNNGGTGTISTDRVLVCADNNYFYVAGNTYSTDFPGTTNGAQPNISSQSTRNADQFISRIPWNGSAGTGFAATYNGGTSTDIVGGLAVDFRSSDVVLFGTTGSTNFPVLQSTPNSPWYQSTFTAGASWSMCYGSFSNDMTTRTYGTYIGGSHNNYLGSTGTLRGSGQLYYNLATGLINIGTTCHSYGPSFNPQWFAHAAFDTFGLNINNDTHFIFEWDPNTFDYGDAPSSYEQGSPARSALSNKVQLGVMIDAETAPYSTSNALGDDNHNLPDEDGVSKPLPTISIGATTYSVLVDTLLNNTGGAITLAGWIDANFNGKFDPTEYATMSIPTSASNQLNTTLHFTGLPAVTYPDSGVTFLRIRLTNGTVTANSDTGEIQAGEVEDYAVCVKPYAGPDQTICLLGTATMAATNTIGTWTKLSTNPGTCTITTPTSATTTITSFSTTGTYNFVWTNPGGCSDTAAVIVTAQPGSLTITPNTVNLCTGGSVILTASVSPTGGTFQWSPTTSMLPVAGNTATVTVDPSSSQTYTVLYSLGGCTSSGSRVVTVFPTPLASSAGPNQTYCSNVSTTISIGGAPTASGGSGHYTYQWSPATRLSSTVVANPTITSIVSGSVKYYVTVTDSATLCTSVDSMTLTINPSVSVSIAISDTNLCLGQSTPLSATGLGTPSGGTYQWSPTVGMTPANGTASAVTVSPSSNQTYIVTYTLNGCTSSASRTVNVYPNLSAHAGGNQTFCLPVTGTVTLGANPAVTGGSGSFTYAWSPSTNLSSTSVANPTITNKPAGSIKYYLTVTDTKSLCSSVDSAIITFDSTATVTISSPDTSLCNGQTSVLTASGSPSGGTYQWSPTNFMTPVAGNTATVSVDPTSNQTYQVTYTANGCSGTANKTVNVVPAVVAHAGGPQTFCMPVTGTITLGSSPTASGGSGSFNYLWTPTTNLSSSTVSNPTITTVVPGVTTYKVLVTDRVSGCTSTDSMVLTINRPDTANAGVSTATCSGSSVILGGSPTGKGGTGTLTYTWSPGTGLTSTSVANPTATPLANTTYDLTVSDTKGCSATSTITITVNPNPSANAGPPQSLVGCSSSSVTIGGSPTGTGGTGTLTYNWSPVGGLDSFNVSNPTVSHLGSKATYTVIVTDANGCKATSSVQVNVTSSTLQVDAGVGGSYCAGSGGHVTLTGNVTGGTGPYVYLWSPSAGLSDTNAISTIANPSAAGSYLYTLNVTDTNGCNASDTVRVNVWPAVVASAGSNEPLCMGSSVTIGGNPTASGGSGSYTYTWGPGGGLDSTTVSNPVASPTVNTTYTVTVTDAKSCSATSSALVSVNALPVAHAGTSQSFCIPVTSTITLGAVPAATGGSGTYTYRWTPSTGLSDSTAANPTVSTRTSTNIEYHLLVTDAVTGCTAKDSTNLTILSQPTVSVASADTNLCTSESAILIATGIPSGGSYQWAPLSNMAPAAGNTSTVTVSPTSKQTYQVIYSQNTCRDTAYKTVNVYPTVTANAGPDQTYCSPVTGTITIGGNPSATGGSGKYSYLWSPITNLNSIIVANPTLTGTSVGSTVYKLTVTDSVTGCTSVDSMVLTINPVVTVSIAPTDTNLCAGQSTTLSATGTPSGGSYQWSPTFNMNPGAGNASTVTVEPSGTQTYQVTYVANGCSSNSEPITIHVYPGVVANAGPDLAYCLPYSGTILLGNIPSASGGSGSYTYSWSPGFNLNSTSTPNPVVTKAVVDTQYILVVTDNVTGCVARDSMHLSINNYPVVSISAPDTNLCFGQSTVLTGVPSPAGGTFSWAPTVYIFPGTGNTQSITVRPSANQIYQLIYSLSGCPDTVYQNVYVYPDVVANAGGNQTFCLPISGTVTLGSTHTATGGSGNYTYLWSPSTNLSSDTVANPTIDSNVATNTTYYLTVTDAVTGCTAVDSMVLVLSPKTTVTITAPQTTICLGSSATLTAVGTPSGGNYQWEPIIAITPANGSSATVEVSPSSGMQTYFVYYNLSGCRDTASVQITTYPQVVADAGLYQVYCLPIRTATIGAPAAGGSGNFSYKWSPGINLSDSTIEMPTVDSIYTPGRYVYTLTVTDNVTGCTSVDSTILTLLPEPHISITAPDTNLCQGQGAVLTAVGTPTGGTYQWGPFGTLSPIAGNTATVTATPTGIGTQDYYVIYNSNEFYYEEDFGYNIQANVPGCIDTAYQALHVYTVPVANAGPDETYCLPLSGSVALGGHPAATGGSGHYKYLWTNAGGDTLSNDTIANPILTGTPQTGAITFYLTVTDSLTGCSSVDSMVLTINGKPTVSIASADTTICAGENAILIATGGPTAGGTYQWSPTLSMTPAAGNTASVTVSPPSTQTYEVVYTLNGCTDTAFKTVNVYPVVVAHAGGPRSYCSPTDTVTLGSIPAATGGSGHYSYTWAPSGTLNNAHIANPVATPTGTTTYYLTVTDLQTNCTSVDSTVVIRNPGPHITLGASAQICIGSSVYLNASGGITYVWSNGSTLSNPNSCCPLAKPDSTTIYTVTVTDINGCTASASDTVTVSHSLVVTIPPVGICAGASANLVPSLIGPNYKYLWTPGTGLNCVTCASPVASPSSTTIYTLQITDTITGCSGTDTVKVTVHPLPQADFFGQQLCQGDTVQFTDESTSVDPIIYWHYNFGDSTLTGDTSDLENPRYAYVTYSAHNAYQIVTTIYGCTDTFHLPVYSLPPVAANAGSNDSIPLGGSTVLGATGGTHFSWSPSAGLSDTTISDPTASPIVTTTYTVTVTNDFGCTATASVTVVVLPLPNVSAGPDTSVCLGYSVRLLGSSTTPGVTYQWTPAYYLDSPNVAQPIATPIAAGIYQYKLTVTQIIGTTVVTSSDSMLLTVNPAPQITAIPDSQNVCSGAPVNISFNSSLAKTTYTWTASNGASGAGNVSTTIYNGTLHDSTVIFTVVGVTPSGCTDTIHVPVIVQPLPVISQSAYPLAICGGTYFVDTALSNNPGTTFSWTSTLGQNGTGADINVLINNPGTVALTDIISITGTYEGCASAVLMDTFKINPLPHANAGANQTIVSCSQDSVQLGGIPTASFGTPGYRYLWTPDLGGLDTIASNPFVKNIGATQIYTVVVTDTNGCVDSSSVKITVSPPTLAVNISENGSLIWCAGSGGSVDFTVNTSGGVPLYAYMWSPNQYLSNDSSQVITANPNTAGTYNYTVVVTDGHGCQASGSVTVTVKPEPHPVITGLDTAYCANVASVPLTASISGGTWSGPGVIGNVFRPSFIGAGTYTIYYSVTVNGCTNDTFQNVTVDPLPVATISGNNPSYCTSDPATTFTGSPSGGTWSGPGVNVITGVFTPDSVSVPNNVSRIVTIWYHYTSAGGCTDSSSISVTVNKSPGITITASADTICQSQTVILTPHYPAFPSFATIQWYDLNGTLITNSLNPITVSPTLTNYGYYTSVTTVQGCTANDTIYISVNPSPVAENDYDTVCGVNTILANVLANDSSKGNIEVLQIVTAAHHGTASVDSNEIEYTPEYGYFGNDSVVYRICNQQCTNDCDTAKLYLSVCPMNLPPVADSIVYTQYDSVPQDVNVSLATSDPNGDPLNISMVGDSTAGGNLTVIRTGNGAYTITGQDTGTFVITYQVCDTDKYPIHVLCDTNVIIAHIIPAADTTTAMPPIANNDFATTSGTTPATVNVRGNDYTLPASDGLSLPALLTSTTGAQGTWSVSSNGNVVFQPNAGLAPGIYYDTAEYRVCDLVHPGLCATAYVIVTVNEIDTPIPNRPPVAVNDHETVPENTTGTFNVKANDSDPDGNPLTIPVLVAGSGPTDGTIVSIGDNGTVAYKPNHGVYSTNGMPVDSFKYSICDSSTHYPTGSLCDSAEVYIYVTPENLAPTADTIRYTQLDSVPQDVNVISATGSPNGEPLVISMVGDSSHGDSLIVVKTGNGAYTITGLDTGTYVIVYQVCDSGQSPPTVLCDTSVIIAHIVPPADTLTPQGPVANNDFATTNGTLPAVVNVRANDYSDPTSHGLTVPVITHIDTTSDGTWSVNAAGDVIFQPNAGLAPRIYHDTAYYQVCDLVNHLCATAYVVVTTDEIDTPIPNRPPVAVNDHETVPENTTGTFNVKANDSDPDGNPLTIPVVVAGSGPSNGTIVSIGDNGTVVYTPRPGVYSSSNGTPADSFRYYICDSSATYPTGSLCDSAEVYIYVTPKNQGPTADTIRYTQLDSVPQDVNVISATGSPNGAPLVISLVGDSTDGGHLTVTKTGNGAYTITGLDTGTYVIVYQVCDSAQSPPAVLCDTSVIIAHIIPPVDTLTPQGPIANNDFATTQGTLPAVVNVRANDYSNPTNHGLTIPTIIAVDSTTDGIWSVDSAGNVIFQPNPGLAPGTYHDTAYYKVCDLVNGLCATAYVVVTTDEGAPTPNRPPVAVNDHETVPENTTGTFNIKTNDSDPDGNPLTIPVVVAGSGPSEGTIVSIGDNGTIVYIPDSNFHGSYTQPADSFRYYICDSSTTYPVGSLCDSAEVYIYVTPVNLPPVANNLYVSTPENNPLGVDVASGASDPNGDPLTYSYPNGTTTTDGGSIVVTSNGAVNYIPPTGFVGTDSFEYKVCDSSPYVVHSLCDSAWVIVQVTPPSDTIPGPPVAVDDYVTTDPGSTITVNVKANDYDPYGFPIAVTAVTSASLPGTTVTINPNNTVNVTVPDSITGNIAVDTFNYTLCDTSHSLCDTATVYVTINKIDTNIINTNRPPVAVDYFSIICADQISTVNLLSRDIDPNGDPLHVAAIVVNPTHGVATVSGVNAIYIPDSTAGGKDSLEYRVCDNRNPELCAMAWVYYTINAVNTRTLAVEDTAVTVMNTPVNVPVVRNDIVADTNYVSISAFTPPTHGTLAFSGTSFTYTPDAGFAGYDTFYYRVCNLRIPGITYCDSFVSTCDVGLVSVFVRHQPPHIDTTYVTIPENTPLDTICPSISDPDGNFVKITGFACGPQHGTAGLTNTGSDSCLTYTPAHDFSGHDTLCVVVCDTVVGNRLCDTAKVYITVTPVCQPPVANIDSYTVNYNSGTVGLNVLANDHNYDTSSLTLRLITNPNCGTALAFANTQVNYTPTTTTLCSDSFKYSICNVGPACTLCDTTTVYVTVKGGTFTPPVAVNDTVSTPENIPVCVHVTANDHQGTNPFQITSACTAHHGTDSIAANGYICYTPELGYIGPDSFCYTICDNSVPALCSTAEVYVTVTPNGFPPIATNDTACTYTGTPVVICVLDNDYDTSGSLAPNTLTLLTSPANGTVTGVNAFGCITFVPNNAAGIDSFRYRICDSTPAVYGGPLCATASVYITVSTVALPPVVTHTTDTILEGDSAIVCPTMTDPDSGIVSITSVCTPLHGTTTLIGTTCVGYTPDPLFFGSDSFCIVTCDQGVATPCDPKSLANMACDTTIIHIIVNHVSHCPIANMDYATGHDSVPVVIDELANDYYVHAIGAGVSVTIVSGPAAGNTAVVNANGTITYTAGASYNGIDTVVYKLTDSIEGCDSTAKIIIYTVTTCVGPNLYPELDSVCEGSILTSTVLNNQFIGNTGLGSFTLVSSGAHGLTVIDTLNNTIVYEPNAGYFGMDTILYQVCDRCSPTPNCAQGILAVDVQYINHTPTAIDDTFSMNENTTDTINVLANDHTVDSVPLTISITAQPVHGTLTLWNNELIYTPDHYYCGVDSFGYLVTEPSGSANCTNDRPWDIGLVFADVICVNQPPYIPDTTIHIPEDTTPVTVCIPFVEHQAGQTDSIYSICPASHGTVISATISNTADDVCVTYQADTNFVGTDSICVVICNDGTPVLCDTSHITIVVTPLIVAVNDSGTTGCHEPVTICVKNNDYALDGHDSFTVAGILVQPAHGTATLDSTTQCVLYTPDGTAGNYPGGIVDSFEYFDKDLSGATAMAWVHVRVICCTIEATNDTFTVATGDTIYANVLANDLISDTFAVTLRIDSSFNGPHNGTVTVVGDSIRYISTSLTFCGIDSFEYIISNACGMDTGLVQVNVNCDTACHKPIAVNDSVSHGYECNDTINVLANDTFAVGASVTVISGPLYGTTAIVNNEIVYIPDGTHPSKLDSLKYMLCNACGKCDTATLKIWLTQYPCNVYPPVVFNDTVSMCRDNDTLIYVLANAYDPDSGTVSIHIFTQGTYGTVTRPNNADSNSYLIYTPNVGFSGVDSFAYQACDNGVPPLCNFGIVFVNVNRCGPPPIVVDSVQYDTTTACTPKQFCIDSIYQGSGYQVYIQGFCDSPSHGTVTWSADTVSGLYGTLCYTYTPGDVPNFTDSCYVGQDTFCLVICNPGPGNDTSCATVNIFVTIQPKTHDSIWVNPYISYTCKEADTLHVLSVDGFIPDPGSTQTGRFIYITEVGDSAGKAPSHGTVVIGAGDSTIIYTPDSGYVGLDTFRYVITNGGTPALYDTGYVLMYICTPPTPIAVNDNNGCMDTTGYVNQANIVINILANDTLVPGTDTMVVIIDSVQHGHLTLNANYTVTYTPDSGFRGNDYFTYVDIESVPGSTGRSDTASVCINIVDTVEVCFFPNGISPNGDGVNDVFEFPCNDKYPNATLRVFNRWGDAIWQSKGAYQNDWGGTNMEGKPIPDGTYYFVYTYNDGSGRSSARFIVVHR